MTCKWHQCLLSGQKQNPKNFSNIANLDFDYFCHILEKKCFKYPHQDEKKDPNVRKRLPTLYKTEIENFHSPTKTFCIIKTIYQNSDQTVVNKNYYSTSNMNFSYFLSHYKIINSLKNKGYNEYIHFKNKKMLIVIQSEYSGQIMLLFKA